MLVSPQNMDLSLGIAMGVAASAVCMAAVVGAMFKESRAWRMAFSLLTFGAMQWVYLQTWLGHGSPEEVAALLAQPLRFALGNAFLLAAVWLLSSSAQLGPIAGRIQATALAWSLIGSTLLCVFLVQWVHFERPHLVLQWAQALLLLGLAYLHLQRWRNWAAATPAFIAWNLLRLCLLILVAVQSIDIQWGTRWLEQLAAGPWSLWVLACVLLVHELSLFGKEVLRKEEVIRKGALQQLEDEVRKRTQDLQQAREHSERMGALQRDFLATMSHELRTPLATIVGISRMVAQSGSLPRSSTRDLGTVERLALQLLQMVDEGLDFVRERGELDTLVERTVNMRVLLRDIESIAKWLAQQQENQLRVLPMRNIPAALIFEERRLRQLIINLLSNAGRYCNKGIVTLGLEFHESPQGCLLHWTIADTGRGMSTQDLERVFEPFVKSRDSKGLGIGLALVKRLANELGAQIKVQSEVNLGSLFIVRVPVKMVEASSCDERINREIDQGSDKEQVITQPMALLSEVESQGLDFERVRRYIKLGQLSEIEDWVIRAKGQDHASDALRRLLVRMERAVADVDLDRIAVLIDQINPPLSRS